MPSLDGIRALAFSVVFLAHAGLDEVVPGGLGVTVFFFLSGYLITTLLRHEFATTGRIDLRRFYLRRALRILPPFYLVLVGSVLVARWGVLRGGYEPDAVLAEALQLANYRIAFRGYHGLPAGTGVYWSLAVEEHFYLLFPLFFLALQRWGLGGRAQARVIWGLCAAVLAWRLLLVLAFKASADRVGLSTDTRVDSILFGCALAVHGNPAVDERPRASSAALQYFWAPASLILLAATLLFRHPVFRETLRYSLQGVALYAPMIVAVRAPRWAPVRLLNVRPVVFVGTLSYSLYLLHHVILNVVEAHVIAPRPAQAGVALALSGILAWGMYQIVEKPCAQLRRRLAIAADPTTPAAGRAREALAG
jgi:peptidoglycan/LPS O-acetylase OafA/YrhL